MNIFFYISTIQGGGAARVMVNLANSFHKNGENVHFAVNFITEHDYELRKGIKQYVIDRDAINNPIQRNIHRIASLRRQIKITNPDICISFMKENNYRLVLSALGLRTRTIVSVRNDPNRVYGSGLKQLVSFFMLGLSDGIVFQTKDAQDYFPKYIKSKSVVIMNEVDDSFYVQSDHLGSYFLAAGRLSKQKNYPMLLTAFKIVCDRHPNVKLKIYGEGKLQDQLQQLTRELDLLSNVSFEGFSDNMMSVYSDAICLLLSSDYEGIPNTVLEALASSVPVISTDCPCGGPRMLIRNDQNGYLVPVGDANAFAEAIEKIVMNEEHLIQLKRGAFESAQLYRSVKIHSEWNKYIRDTIIS